MKKGFLISAAALMLGLAVSTPSYAHNGTYHLTLNGVNVDTQDGATVHMMPNGHMYASVDLFTKYYGATYTWDEASKTLTINGKVMPNTNGEAHVHDGVLTAPVSSMAVTLGTDNGKPHYAIGYDTDLMQTNVSVLPEGVTQLTPSVPQMGEHWADPKNMPLGPIYGISNGKLVFLEYMPAKDLDKTVHDVPGNQVPIPANINHMDIDWNPQGHQGYEVPHYDVHLYFIDREEQNKIPNGFPPGDPADDHSADQKPAVDQAKK